METVRALVTGRDVQEMLQVLAERTRDLLRADEVGILLADGKGALQVVTATGSDIRLLELYELEHGDGPCTEASQTVRRSWSTTSPDMEALLVKGQG